jgi:isoleucyl-tRNA synthetase
MADYREDMRFGKEIYARVVESYRKIRNVLRVLVANLYDFDPAVDALPRGRLLEIDRFALARYATTASKIVKAYDDYDYPGVYQLASSFITVDASAFYVDVTKDRMYTLGSRSDARRSGQTAMYVMVEGLARLLAPILPFTMDELWRNLPGTREASVHLALFPSDMALWDDDELQGRWEQLIAVRNQVNGALEEKRQQKAIGSNLSARVLVSATGDVGTLLMRYRDELATLFGVSQVEVQTQSPDAGLSATGEAVQVVVERAEGIKCERCWRYVPEVSDSPEFKGLCERCVEALAEPVNG